MDFRINMTFLPIKMAYFLFMAAFSCMIPYLPVFYTQLGMLVWQVGLIRGFEPILVFIFSPLWGAFADKYSKHKLALQIAVAGTGLFYFLIFFVPFLANAVTEDQILYKSASECSLTDLGFDGLQCEKDISLNLQQEVLGSVNCPSVCETYAGSTPTSLDYLRTCTHASESLDCMRCDQTMGNTTNSLFIAIASCGGNSSDLQSYVPQNDPLIIENLNCELTKCCQCVLETGVPTSQKLTLIFALCFILAMISVFFNCNILSFLDSNLMELLGENRKDYGKHRLWGAVGWGICASVSGAAIDLYTSVTNSTEKRYEPLFVIYVIMALLTLIVVSNMTFPVHQTPHRMQKNLMLLAKRPDVIMFLLVMVVEGICFGMAFSHVMIFLGAELHANHTLLGLSILATCIAETPMLFLSGWVVKHIGYRGVIYLTLIAYAVRYLGYSVLYNAWWVLPVQLLHGITFGIGWPGFTAYANSIAPKGMAATLQAIMAATYIGIGTAIGNIVGGFLYELIGYRWLFGGASIMCVIMAVIYFIVDWTIISRMQSSEEPEKKVELHETENGKGDGVISNGKSSSPEMDGMLENTNHVDEK